MSMEETLVLTAIKGFLRRLAKSPIIIESENIKINIEGFVVQIHGIQKIAISAKKGEES